MFTINKSVSVWEQLVQLPFLNLYSRLLNAAMELDVFSQLCQPVTAEALAVHMGWHKANTEYLLSALVSIGFLNKTDGTYQNTAEVDRYLVKGKDEYLGGFLPFYMQEGMAPMDVKLLVTKGPQSQQQEAMEQQLDLPLLHSGCDRHRKVTGSRSCCGLCVLCRKMTKSGACWT